jgi:hypothetical protein
VDRDIDTGFSMSIKRDSASIYHTQGGGGPLRLTELFGGQIFNDVYMMNFTPKTPKWLNTEADYL